MLICEVIVGQKPLHEKFKTQRKGSKGPAVKETQKMLIQLGHLAPTWTSKKSGKSYPSDDGNFGGGTARAVIAFQKANGLDADGIIGPTTIRTLINVADKKDKSELVATHTKKMDAATADRDATIKKVLAKREATLIGNYLDLNVKGKVKPQYASLYPHIVKMFKAHGTNNVEQAKQMATHILKQKEGIDIDAMSFTEALAEFLRRSTDLPEPEVQSVTKKIMALRKENLELKKMTPGQAVAKHGTEKQKLAMKDLNKRGREIDKKISAIDNKTVDGVPVGSKAKADLEKRASARNAYDMATGGVG